MLYQFETYLHFPPSSGSPKAFTSITESASFTPTTSNHILFLISGDTLFLQCFFSLDLLSINLPQFPWVTGLEREHWAITLDSTNTCDFVNSLTSGSFHSTRGEKHSSDLAIIHFSLARSKFKACRCYGNNELENVDRGGGQWGVWWGRNWTGRRGGRPGERRRKTGRWGNHFDSSKDM